MAIKNTHSKVDIYIHADIVQKRTNTASEKQVNPNTSSNNDKNASGWGNGSFSIKNKRGIHLTQNLMRSGLNVTRQYINASVGQLGNITGDSNYQASLQRKNDIINDYASSSFNVVSATISGAMIGGVVGGVAALITSGIGTTISLANKYESRNIENVLSAWKENQSVNYNKARAGVDLTDGRTRLR